MPGVVLGAMHMVMRPAMIMVVRWATVARPSGHGRKAFGATVVRPSGAFGGSCGKNFRVAIHDVSGVSNPGC